MHFGNETLFNSSPILGMNRLESISACPMIDIFHFLISKLSSSRLSIFAVHCPDYEHSIEQDNVLLMHIHTLYYVYFFTGIP